jgi:integrase
VQNEGTIYRRKDGRWTATLTLGYEGGKRKRKSFYGATQREVQAQLKKALHDQQQGLPVSFARQTLEEFLARWLEDSVKPSVRPSTYTGYEVLVRVHIVPELGKIQLAQLTPQQLQTFMKTKLDSGLSPRTVQYMRAVLRRALGQALKWSLLPRNVAALVDPPRVKRAEIQPWTPEQARAFLDAVKGDRLEALYSVAVALGLRRGEALALRWADVDLDKGSLTVRASLQRVGGQLQLVETKTERSRRTIALPRAAVTALRAHRVRQLEERLAAGENWQDTGMVFTSSIGTMIDPRNVNRQFGKALSQAGLPHTRFHDLRHTCASLLLVQGVHPRVVMEILGHSKISVTMDTYSHVIPTLQRDAADRMDALLSEIS